MTDEQHLRNYIRKLEHDNNQAAAEIERLRGPMTDDCALCDRPLGKHSFNTRDVCNMFIGKHDPFSVLTNAWKQIGDLRRPEGHSITLICDNPDFNGKPNSAVIVVGDWTDWEDRRFEANTVFECVALAHAAYLDSIKAIVTGASTVTRPKGETP